MIVILTEMNRLALLTALCFGALQSVTIIDCPCAALCGHKNACEEAKEASTQDDCCRESRSGTLHEEACFHLEPQCDVDGPLSESPVAAATSLPANLPTIVPPPESFEATPPTESPPARDCPLYLQQSRLLI